MKKLDKELDDILKRVEAETKKAQELRKKKIQVLGDRGKLPFFDLTDDEIKAYAGKEADKLIKQKNDILKKRPKGRPSYEKTRSARMKPRSIEDKLMSGALGWRGAKKEKVDHYLHAENPSGKFRMKATIDIKNKIVYFKGQVDDMLSVKQDVEEMGWTFVNGEFGKS